MKINAQNQVLADDYLGHSIASQEGRVGNMPNPSLKRDFGYSES